jgi:hypothetical protein
LVDLARRLRKNVRFVSFEAIALSPSLVKLFLPLATNPMVLVEIAGSERLKPHRIGWESLRKWRAGAAWLGKM